MTLESGPLTAKSGRVTLLKTQIQKRLNPGHARNVSRASAGGDWWEAKPRASDVVFRRVSYQDEPLHFNQLRDPLKQAPLEILAVSRLGDALGRVQNR